MPNKITITAQTGNTTKTIEYLHPNTNVWQSSNILTNVAAGTYNNLKARLKGSNPEIAYVYTNSVTVTNGALNKDAIIGIGDSIERADQATVEAGFPTGTGTNPFQAANGATGNVGKQTSTERAVDILNTNLGTNRFDAYSVGYPSKTSFFFIRNYLTNFFSTFDFSKYDNVLVSLAFGANDLIFPEQPGDSTKPADIYAAIVNIANTLKALNSKVKIFVSPTLNRTYNDSPGHQQPDFANFDDKRQLLNNLLLTNINSYGSGAANIFNQTVGLKNTPFNYPNDWFGDGSHPTVKGQTEIGLERARMFARFLNITLSQGNGSEPAVPIIPVTATISVNPQSAVANTQRVATATINNFTGTFSAQLIKQPTQGSGTNISIGNPVTSAPYSVNFTPAEDGYFYYFRLTPSNGSIFFTDAKQVGISASGSVTETAAWGISQKLAYDSNANTLTSQNTGNDNWSNYANATKKINASGLADSIIEFPAITRRNSGDVNGLFLGLCSTFIPLGVTNAIPRTKYMFYSDGGVLRIFVNGAYVRDVNWVTQSGAITSLRMIINPSAKPDGIYFYDGSTQVDYIQDNYTADLYVVVSAGNDGLVLPPVSITSSGLVVY